MDTIKGQLPELGYYNLGGCINQEVNRRNESDDEDTKSEKSVRFGNASDDEGSWTDETNSMIRCV